MVEGGGRWEGHLSLWWVAVRLSSLQLSTGRAMGEVLVYVEKCLHVHYLESNRERCWCCSKLEGLYTLLCTFESFRVMC